MEWFTNLDWFAQTFWIIALIGSLFFLIMLVATFIGGDIDADVDADVDFDVDGGGFHFFTIKNLIAFFTIFGWSGIAALDADFGKLATIATLCGIVMMLIMATMFYFVSKLNDSGTLNIQNAIGAIGEVYLTVGAERSRIGKVSVRIQGSLREMEALTDEDKDLATGTVVSVRDVTSNGILIIDRLTNK